MTHQKPRKRRVGAPVYPANNPHPWLRQIFDRQDALCMTIVELSEKSGLSTYKIKRLRRPNDSHGLIWRVDEVEALAHAVGFKWPARLELKNERTERAGLPGAADGQRGRNHSEGNAVSAGR